MILSVSRRTDIPAYFSEWFMKRLENGFVIVQSPYTHKLFWRISLSPDVVDCMVFWTKNPSSMLDKLEGIENMGYKFYFQFTITPYGRDIERNVPSRDEMMAVFRRLSLITGPDRVVWRYDPVILDEDFTASWHLEQFDYMCSSLKGYTRRCVFSFLDIYRNMPNRFKCVNRNSEDAIAVARGFVEIASHYAISLSTCSENLNLETFDITRSSCIDRQLVEDISGYSIDVGKDGNQRRECGCIESLDIGTYNTCHGGCRYCYASGRGETEGRYNLYDVNSLALCVKLHGDECVKDRKVRSHRSSQQSLFS